MFKCLKFKLIDSKYLKITSWLENANIKNIRWKCLAYSFLDYNKKTISICFCLFFISFTKLLKKVSTISKNDLLDAPTSSSLRSNSTLAILINLPPETWDHSTGTTTTKNHFKTNRYICCFAHNLKISYRYSPANIVTHAQINVKTR